MINNSVVKRFSTLGALPLESVSIRREEQTPMTYFMTFSESMKAIRPADGLRLRMPTKHGADIEVHLYQSKFRDGPSCLVTVPTTPANLTALGLDADLEYPHSWIIPPFGMLSGAFKKGGPFIRDGKLDSIPIDLNKVAIFDEHEVYRPDLGCFVPEHLSNTLPWGTTPTPLDRSDWKIKMWVTTVVTRPATEEERKYLLVPWTDFNMSRLDLWLEQYRCWHKGLPIPTEISYPDEDPDYSDTVTQSTKTGLTVATTVLDESAGDDAGKHQLTLECAVGSTLDEHVKTIGYEANGYFFEALATYWAKQNNVAGLWMNPTADRITILGAPGQITPLKSHILRLTRHLPRLDEAVTQAAEAGIEFD